MMFGAQLASICGAATDALTQLAQPGSRPGELEPENGETGWNDEQPRSRRNQHNDTEQDYGDADHRDDDATRKLVSEFNQDRWFPLMGVAVHSRAEMLTITLGVLMPLA